jgi:hypothetical protein
MPHVLLQSPMEINRPRFGGAVQVAVRVLSLGFGTHYAAVDGHTF